MGPYCAQAPLALPTARNRTPTCSRHAREILPTARDSLRRARRSPCAELYRLGPVTLSFDRGRRAPATDALTAIASDDQPTSDPRDRADSPGRVSLGPRSTADGASLRGEQGPPRLPDALASPLRLPVALLRDRDPSSALCARPPVPFPSTTPCD